MKKQLLASTMLVAAGALGLSSAANAKFEVTVNGYQEAILGIILQDEEDLGHDTSWVDVDYDGETHFNARTELDNGIAIRAHVELENGHHGAGEPNQRINTGTGTSSATVRGHDTIDEEYIIVRGNFGQFTIGAEDNAGHLMTIGYSGSWATQVGQNLSFDIGDFINRGGGSKPILWDVRLGGSVTGENDSTKISYYTPRMAGFQLGASYIPNFVQDDNAPPDATNTQHDGIALGANFQRKFGNFGLALAAGYMQASGATNHNYNPDVDAPDDEDTEIWNVAARFDFGPARIAAVYRVVESDPAGSVNEGEAFEIGGRLRFGPNAFSLTYNTSENDTDEKQDRGMLSYARTLGPGVTWTANVMYNNYEPASGDSLDGSAISTSIKLRY